MTFDRRCARLTLVLGACLALAACGGDDGAVAPTGARNTAPGASPPNTPSGGAPSGDAANGGAPNGAAGGAPSGGAATNTAPKIAGTPPTAVLQDTPYSFLPTASDDDGDSLIFTIANLPRWAGFNPLDGHLHGTPSPADVGTYPDIVITVSDGEAESSLAPFSITVQPTGNGSAVLSWLPPTENDDGSPLTDLAGYRLYWGTKSGEYPNSIAIDNPGVTTYVVENLVPATYYFVATAVNSEGTESEHSNEASSTVL